MTAPLDAAALDALVSNAPWMSSPVAAVVIKDLAEHVRRLSEAVARVREVHVRAPFHHVDLNYCHVCAVPLPCPTIAALDATPAGSDQ